MIKLTTTLGDITIELDNTNAEISSENFHRYVDSGHFDGLIFHRVIPGFMIQGGGFTPDMQQRTVRAPIENEADNGLKNDKYTIAMARTNDPHSATSQFFINVADNSFLNHSSKTAQGWGYAVFGRVIEGMEVVDQIEAVQTTQRAGHSDVPTEVISIEKAVTIE